VAPGCPSVSMRDGPWGAGSANDATLRNHATDQFVATWVSRAGHAQITAIHFRAIKQHPIILK
jgi:hypothetical protein